MTASAAYKDRTYDLVAFQGIKEAGSTLAPQQLTDPPALGRVCTGTAKLAQRFLLEFLTPLGSMPYNPTHGSSFMPALRRGELHTELAVFAAFAYAVAEIAQTLRREELPTDPDDERFADAELAGLGLSSDRLTLSIELTTAAGTARPIILPLPILP